VRLREARQLIRLYFRLGPHEIRLIERKAAILVGGALTLTLAAHSASGIPDPIRSQVTLAADNGFANGFASMLLFFVGLVGLVCAGIERQAAAKSYSKWRANPTVVAWGAIAAWFFVLSLDEMGSIHELLSERTTVSLLFAEFPFLEGWGTVFVVPLVAVAVAGAFAWAGRKWLRTAPRVLPLLVAGVLLFLYKPVQEYFAVTSSAAEMLTSFWVRPVWQIVVEEGTKLLATLCFLSAGLRFTEHRSRELGRQDGKIGLEIGWALPLAAIAIYVLGLGALYAVGPDTTLLLERQGVPSNWFPATAAFLGLLLAQHLARAERGRIGIQTGSVLVFQMLAVANFVLSAIYAANFPVYRLLDNRPVLQNGWMFAVGAGALVIGMFAARTFFLGVAVAGLLAWTMSFLIRPVLAPGSWAPLLLFAHLAQLVSLHALLTERARKRWNVLGVVAHGGRDSIQSKRRTV
jgi:hypothetical protein